MDKKQNIIVIIDDDQEVGKIVSDILDDEGYSTRYFSEGASAIKFIAENHISAIFLDLWFNNDESAGISILKNIKKYNRHIPVIMISGHGNIDIAVKVLKLGAYDFIEKPFNLNKLLITAQRAHELSKLRRENEKLRLQSDFNTYLLGGSSEISRTRNLIKKSAPTNSRILLTAKPGSGINLIARYIYENSPRSDDGFEVVDCSMTQDELDKTLFGTRNSVGLIEKLDSGTLLLSNIDYLSNDLQIKLLKFLQNGTLQPVEASYTKSSSARILSSCTDSNIEDLVYEKKFKRDLLLRLGVVRIDIPPISSRRDDISTIVNYLLDNSETMFNIRCKKIDKTSMSVLCSYDWPGNVKQLQNVVELACIMAGKDGIITVNSLPKELITNNKSKVSDISKLLILPLKEAREVFEKNYISMQMNRFSGNVSQVANFIGMERSALHRKLKNLEILNMRHRGTDE